MTKLEKVGIAALALGAIYWISGLISQKISYRFSQPAASVTIQGNRFVVAVNFDLFLKNNVGVTLGIQAIRGVVTYAGQPIGFISAPSNLQLVPGVEMAIPISISIPADTLGQNIVQLVQSGSFFGPLKVQGEIVAVGFTIPIDKTIGVGVTGIGSVGMPEPKMKDEYIMLGGTNDIISVMVKAAKIDHPDMCAFASQFKTDNPKDGLRKLHDLMRETIEYRADKSGEQLIKLPARLWKDGHGDCKSYTLFVVAVCKCLGLPVKMKFVDYDGSDFTHVYPVVTVKGKDIPVDVVYSQVFQFDSFGSEKPYHKAKIISV